MRPSNNHLSYQISTFEISFQPSLCLQFANKAFGRFWGNADPIQPDTHLSNAEIAKWIVKESNHQISTTMAEKIAQIIRPEWAHKGRKPNI